MKDMIKITFACVLLILAASCSKERPAPGLNQYGQEIGIELRVGTRAGERNGDDEDYYINSLRMLGYRVSDGRLAFNVEAYGLPGKAADKDVIQEKVQVLTGEYTIIFIANEHSDFESATTPVSDILNGITKDANNTLEYFKDNVTFSRSAFNNDRNIPMAAIRENILITGEYSLTDNGMIAKIAEQGDVYTIWPVSMKRLGVRLDVKIANAEERGGVGDDLTVSNIPSKVCIFEKANAGGYSEDLVIRGGDNPRYTWNRIILPENILDDKTDEGDAMRLSITVDGEQRSIPVYDMQVDDDYNLYRNHHYILNCAILYEKISFFIEVVQWDDGENEEVNEEIKQ